MLMIDTRMEPAIAKSMVQGAPDTLHSEFHLSYAMLLNLLLSEAADPESLLRASFRQFQVERSLPALTQRIAQLEVSRGFVITAVMCIFLVSSIFAQDVRLDVPMQNLRCWMSLHYAKALPGLGKTLERALMTHEEKSMQSETGRLLTHLCGDP